MSGNRKKISAGTLLMVVLTTAVLCCTVFILGMVRSTKTSPRMDAKRLVSYLGELALAVQPAQSEPPAGMLAVTSPPASVQRVSTAATTGAAAPAVTQAPQINESVYSFTMTIGGDVSLSEKVLYGTHERSDGANHPERLFAYVSDTIHADINLALLDPGVIAGAEAAADCTQALKSAGFNVVMQRGENALLRQALSDAGITTCSGEPLTRTINGVPLAFLQFSEEQTDCGIDAYSAERAATVIADAREQGAAMVIVLMGWSGDNEEPTQAQRAIAQELCDAGVDLLIGFRPYMMFPVGYLHSQTGQAHQMLTIWSAGTLLSESRASRAAVSSALLHLHVKYEQGRNRISYTNIQYTPVYTWGQDEGGRYRHRLVQSAQPAPEGMNQKQKDIMGRALKLIQDTMSQGVAAQLQ